MAETCETCRWWRRDPNRPGMIPLDGTCLRYPPTAVTSYRPRTRNDDMCGEHSLKSWRPPMLPLDVATLHDPETEDDTDG